MKAEDAAVLLQAKRGYVITCQVDGDGSPYEPGDRVKDFSGGPLSQHVLNVVRRATFADWDTQLSLMDSLDIPRKHVCLTGREAYSLCMLEALNGRP